MVSRLGRGGMGEVYRASTRICRRGRDQAAERRISEDRDHVQRFFNEARMVSKIKHAGTVKIFDVGFHDGQRT